MTINKQYLHRSIPFVLYTHNCKTIIVIYFKSRVSKCDDGHDIMGAHDIIFRPRSDMTFRATPAPVHLAASGVTRRKPPQPLLAQSCETRVFVVTRIKIYVYALPFETIVVMALVVVEWEKKFHAEHTSVIYIGPMCLHCYNTVAMTTVIIQFRVVRHQPHSHIHVQSVCSY